jgi:hypothetical protein
MRGKIISFFVLSSGSLLVLTAVAKLISSYGADLILTHFDPIFLISFARFFQAAAVVELAIAFICFLNINPIFQTGLIALLATNFLIYRFGFYWLGYHSLCPCLGNLADELEISPQIVDIMLKIILTYLLVGGYATFFSLWWQYKKPAPTVSA